MEIIEQKAPHTKLFHLRKISGEYKILNKYLGIEILSYAFKTEDIVSRVSLLSKTFNQFAKNEIKLIESLSVTK